MAKQKGNVVTHGLSGMIGKQLVFRQLNGQTVVSAPPRVSGKATEKQREQRQKFQRAVLYANAVLVNPEWTAVYAAKAKKGLTVRNLAIADFMHAPDIKTIDISDYHGQSGDVIRIEATDDFAVKEVRVVISTADGDVVEEGQAQPEAAGFEWTYKTAQANDHTDGGRIEVYASDMPGNISKAITELR